MVLFFSSFLFFFFTFFHDALFLYTLLDISVFPVFCFQTPPIRCTWHSTRCSGVTFFSWDTLYCRILHSWLNNTVYPDSTSVHF